jgi:hypothetical protein
MSKRRGKARPVDRKPAGERKGPIFSVERLAGDLSEVYEVELDAKTGHILVHAWDDRGYRPPVRLVATEQALREHLRALADDGAAGVFPEATPMQAAYQLFLVHLDEEMATRVTDGSEITFGPGRLDVEPLRAIEQLPDLDPDRGDYWSAGPGAPEPGAGLQFMSPEQYRARYGREPVLPTDDE